MKVYVIGGYLSDNHIRIINSISTQDSQVSIAALKYSHAIRLGFCENLNGQVKYVNMPTIGMYPSCKMIYCNLKADCNENYISFLNIFGIKQITIFIKILLKVIIWNFNSKSDNKVVVFTFLYLPFQFIIPFLKLFTKIKFVSFVPDLPSYSYIYTPTRSILKKILLPIFVNVSNYINNYNDYFVFITQQMASKFKKKNYSIIEGFVSINNAEKAIDKSEVKSILYSGALYEKFGILSLVKAFTQIQGNYELWLCGSGDVTEEIKLYAEKDSRIKYLGVLPNSEVVSHQKSAHILINPRLSSEEFTKYSFPSKLLEYAASGTPVLTTRLPGIPEEYFDKFYFIDDESISGMRCAMQNILEIHSAELENRGKILKNYVLAEKNNIVQINKLILELNEVFFK